MRANCEVGFFFPPPCAEKFNRKKKILSGNNFLSSSWVWESCGNHRIEAPITIPSPHAIAYIWRSIWKPAENPTATSGKPSRSRSSCGDCSTTNPVTKLNAAPLGPFSPLSLTPQPATPWVLAPTESDVVHSRVSLKSCQIRNGNFMHKWDGLFQSTNGPSSILPRAELTLKENTL